MGIGPGDEVAVIGAGTMGRGIAELSARAGHPTRIHDGAPGAAEAAVRQIEQRLRQDTTARRMEPDVAAEILDLLRPEPDLARLAGCHLVIETVTEDLAVKREVLAAAERVMDAGAVLATNTSSLSVTALATVLARPDRFVGLHFFNPAPRMALVEVVRGERTTAATVSAVTELARHWGKTPVVCACTPGFVVNRIARPFYGEAHRLAEQRVADPATIDAVLREAGGFPMGPFQLGDLVGHDVGFAVSTAIWEQTFHDPRYAPTVFHRQLVDAGRLGRKTGRGVFSYGRGSSGATVALDAVPHTAAPRPAPATVDLVEYDFGVMEPFLARIEAGGVRVRRVTLDDDQVLEELPGLRLPGEGLLRVTDGSTARSWTVEAPGGVVLLDWAHDPAGCTRVALMPARNVDPQVLDAAIGVCQAAGVTVSVIGDAAGGIVARTVSMLVNEAVDLVARGEASATDVDVAMLLGAGHPSGPLEWGDRVNALRVAAVLAELDDEVPTGRYRISPRLEEAIVGETNLRDL